MEYAMLGIGVALGMTLAFVIAMAWHMHGLDKRASAETQRMSMEIKMLAASHAEIAHIVTDIQDGISRANAMLNEHDQMIAFMRHPQDEDYPVH